MQCPFLDCLVERGSSLAIDLLGGSLVALGDGFAHIAQLGAQAGGIGAVPRRAGFSLTGALQRRKMICHVWFVTFVCSERYSTGSEFLIIGEHLSTGQTDVPHGETQIHEPEAHEVPRSKQPRGFLRAPACPSWLKVCHA